MTTDTAVPSRVLYELLNLNRGFDSPACFLLYYNYIPSLLENVKALVYSLINENAIISLAWKPFVFWIEF